MLVIAENHGDIDARRIEQLGHSIYRCAGGL